MTKEMLQQLYKEKILPENRSPYHFEKRVASHPVLAYNPLCGDRFELFLDADNGQIDQIYFHGIGCAISKASTSILARKLASMTEAQAIGTCQAFLEALGQENDSNGLDQELQILAELKHFEGRMDCVKLSWKAVLDHLKTKSI